MTTIWFGVLGPLEVRADGCRIGLNGPRQERALAALLLGAGAVVTFDELVDAVWERPPATARRQVQDLVGRLRRDLAGAGAAADLITTRGSGYLLRPESAEIDAYGFEQLLAQARQEPDPLAAAKVYREALRLWRGEPLAGLGSPRLERSARIWQERHLLAWEECLEAELSLPGARDVTAELAALADRHPFREPLVDLLMRALDGAGRRPEALAAYHRLRLRLSEELGLDPGPRLQDRYAAMLHSDPAPPRSATPAVPAPAQLPLAGHGFAGRGVELARLHALLPDDPDGATTVVAVVGTGGVGKTTLAVHFAHRVARRFPDGQLYVNLRGFDPGGTALATADAVRGFLGALGVPADRVPADEQAGVALYRSLLAGRRMLVLLDNARDATQVRPLLPGSAGTMVLVTSRDRLAGLVVAEGAHPVTLGVLTAAESREVLARRLGPLRLAAEPDAVAEIVARCAGLPLALRVVAARAALQPDFPLRRIAGDLGEGEVLDALGADDSATDPRSVLSWSYRLLSAPAARLFRLLGLHPGPDWTLDAAAAAAGVPVDQARRSTAELVGAHLVVQHQPGRYTCHDLLRAYAAELATTEPDDRRQAARQRLLDHYLHTAFAADRLLLAGRRPIELASPGAGVPVRSFDDIEQAQAWLDAEHAVLVGAVAAAESWGCDVHVRQLAWSLATYLQRRGHWRDWTATQEAAVRAARRLGDRAGQADTHRGLGRALALLGRHDGAMAQLDAALALFVELADPVGQTDTHLGMSWVRERQTRLPEAVSHARQALALSTADGYVRGQASALNSLGWYHTVLGDHEQALSCCEQSLALHRRGGDLRGQAEALDSAGYAHLRLGRHERAVDCYGQALELFRRLGDRYLEAYMLDRIGDGHAEAGAAVEAARCWRAAVVILAELGHPDEAETRRKLDPD
ncbi:BTAD domain-containing putative transcriptional regulator [Catellatospora sp. KI3]|uniref:AfsR/SARP family transcriptional regulator n=1 Tax=Catellatospora sp. KI3 TaxID=3041620 RepID=UPI002482B46B|nr:BTAD domain-containing putative transcriptional regulator [Catellatospora sp. KI3]MDI1463162.1 BTAD domain-containing putative transcriptional regulator [Catellatospora sp. KI3]